MFFTAGVEFFELALDNAFHASSEIWWASCDETEMIVMRELGAGFLDVSVSTLESTEELVKLNSLSHGDDSKLVLLVAPDDQVFVIIYEEASSWRPVFVQFSGLIPSIPFFEKTVISSKLIFGLFTHILYWLESTFKITFEGLGGSLNHLHYLLSLHLRNTWPKWESFEVSTYPDFHRSDNGSFWIT